MSSSEDCSIKLEKLIKKDTKKKTKQIKKKQVLIFIVAVVLTLLLVCGVGVYVLENNYQDAVRYMEVNKDYERARELFDKYVWYRDSSEKMLECEKMLKGSK